MVNALLRWCLANRLLMALTSLGLCIAGYFAALHATVDAIPDIGEKQVIVYADWTGRSPQDVDDQVTFPLTTSLAGTPGVKAIRSMSGFGFAMVFLIFRDDVDYYWARSRVIERINAAQQRLPAGVTPLLGPDATALGQIYWYTVEGEGFDLAELRSIQDWYVRYQLNSVEGVSEVSSIGGFVKQYQIDVHPDRMRAHRVSLFEVYDAVVKSNIDVGAKVVEQNGVEYFIRGVGFVKTAADLERIVIREKGGTPLTLGSVATVQLGPDFRRGALDKGGVEAAGGVVLMRYGENPRRVMERLRTKLEQLEPGLPRKTLADGRVSAVRIVPFYDRSTIVRETLETLRSALAEEAVLASLVLVIFVLHLRTTAAVLSTLPLAVAFTFTLMYLAGVDSNVMSLAGLAVAIGGVSDMGIIMSESIYRRIASASDEERRERLLGLIYEGAAEVGGAIATAGSNTLICFLPVFFLTDQEGKLFRPLAFTKTFAIGASIALALTVVPFLCSLLYRCTPWSHARTAAVAALCGVLGALAVRAAFSMELIDVAPSGGWLLCAAVGVGIALCVVRMTHERFLPLEENPVSRGIHRVYAPALGWILDHKLAFLCLPLALALAGGAAWRSLGREFMPALDEGSFLYMPSLLPQASLSQAIAVNSVQDRAIASVPEVDSVVGKIGRAESAIDPAPIGMTESIILLRPESEWRMLPVERFFSGWPALLREPLGWLWPEHRRITRGEILADLQRATAIPGVLPTFLQPIQTRLVMLQSGFRAMMGVKIYGSDLHEIERIGLRIEQLLRDVPGATDIVADRIVGKPYIQIEIDRDRIGRYGVNIRDVQDVIEMALGGVNLMESVEGRERYPIRVRLARDFREDADAIERVSVPTASGAQVPLAQLASIRTVLGPQEIKGERGLLVGYVTLNTRDRDEVSVVEDAEALLQTALRDGRLQLPPGYYWEWSGQFENQVRAIARMRILIPLTLAILFAMLMLGFQRWWMAPIIFADVFVSACAGFLLLALWDVNLSVAVWVGFLMLFGVVDDDSVVIGTYLEQVFEGRSFRSIAEIRAAVLEAGLRRIRPCLMTTATTVFGLLPIFWATGRGADVMRPMAMPAMGGVAASLITMFIVPCLFCAVEEQRWKRRRPLIPEDRP